MIETYMLGIMERRGISQSELARRVGCNRSQISRYMTRKAKPSLGVAIRLSIALDANIFVLSKEMGWIDCD